MEKSTKIAVIITSLLAFLSVLPIFFGVKIAGRYASEDIGHYIKIINLVWVGFFIFLSGIKKLGFEISQQYFKFAVICVSVIVLLGILKFKEDLRYYDQKMENSEKVFENELNHDY